MTADWDSRTTGRSEFVGDVRLPDMAYAAVVRSERPHAKIKAIDFSKALEIPGVIDFVCADDINPVLYIHRGGVHSDRTVVAREKVRFVGEELGAVVADNPTAARAGVEAVRVKYRTLDAAFNAEQSAKRKSPEIHARSLGQNHAAHIERTYGRPPTGEPQAVVRQTYHFARQAQAPLETSGTVALWSDGRLHIWTSTQAPYFARKELANYFAIDIESVITHEVAVGGGFGGKAKIGEHEVLAAVLARKIGRPVQLLLSRVEEFSVTKPRHPFTVGLEVSADSNGRLMSLDAQLRAENGAYNHTGPTVLGSAVNMLVSQYPFPSASVVADLYDTNVNPGGSFRGYGVPQAFFALESAVDELAAALGIDPLELRLRNVAPQGSITNAGFFIETTALRACLETLRSEFEWDERRKHSGPGVGIGMAVAIHVSGIHAYDGSNESAAQVEINADGEIEVRFAGGDPGTGLREVLSRVVAEELGVNPQEVRSHTMASDVSPYDMGSWSSRGTVMAAGSAQEAGKKAAAILKQAAAEKLGLNMDQVELAGGFAGDAETKVELGDLVGLISDNDPLEVRATFEAPVERVNPESGVADISSSYSFAAHAVEVHVDELTGAVRVTDYLAVHDAGHVVNPIAAESQVIGGVAMGIGAAITEEIRYEGGRVVNPSFMQYGVPRASDLPDIRVKFVPSRSARAPLGVKSVGEIALTPVAPAVANAIAHATGRRIRSLPLTPDKVIRPSANQKGRVRRYSLWRRPSRWWISLMRALYPKGLLRSLRMVGPDIMRQEVTEPLLEVPTSVQSASDILRRDHGSVPLGGGTDIQVRHSRGQIAATRYVAVGTIPSFKKIDEDQHSGRVIIGSGVTLTALEQWSEERGVTWIADAVRSIASVQIRNAATVAGNLCQEKRCWFFRNDFPCYKRTSSPLSPCYAVTGPNEFHHAIIDAHRCQAVTPSDLATIFCALNARVGTVLGGEKRSIAMSDFYVGPGEPRLAKGEIVTHVEFARDELSRSAGFHKLALWTGDFAISSAVASLDVTDEGTIADARIVLGGVAWMPWRLSSLERSIVGKAVSAVDPDALSISWLDAAHPLKDNEWKVDATSALLSRALKAALRSQEG